MLERYDNCYYYNDTFSCSACIAIPLRIIMTMDGKMISYLLHYYHQLFGLEFLLNSISIPTDGSGRVLITEFDFTGQGALVCQSSSLGGDREWYLDPEDENATSIAEADKINF